MDSKKLYLCSYSEGSYEDEQEINVFATYDEDKAFNWCNKFNDKLDKWHSFMNRYTTDRHRDESKCVDAISERYYQIFEINHAYYNEIELR